MNRLKWILLFIIVAFIMSTCSCTFKKDDNSELYKIKPKQVFSANGYFLNNNHDLFHCSEIGSVILSDIIHVYGFENGNNFAIDKDGNVWGWGANHYGSLGLGHLNYQETPEKVKTVNDIASVLSCPRKRYESKWSGSYTLFLTKAGSIFAVGTSNKFDSILPIEIEYKGDAVELLDIDYEEIEFAIKMKNNDLVNAQLFDKEITTNILIKDCEEVFSMYDFCIALTNDGQHYGWGRITYLDEITKDYYDDNIAIPSKISGMGQMITCSQNYIGMDDGSFWHRKKNLLHLSGESIPDIKDVICIQEPYMITAKGELYYCGSDTKDIYKVHDTGYNFTYKKSTNKYNLDLENDFWKFGGYHQ